MDQAPTLGMFTEVALATCSSLTHRRRPPPGDASALSSRPFALTGALAGGLCRCGAGAHERFERLQQSNELVLARLEQTRTQLDGVATQSKTLVAG